MKSVKSKVIIVALAASFGVFGVKLNGGVTVCPDSGVKCSFEHTDENGVEYIVESEKARLKPKVWM